MRTLRYVPAHEEMSQKEFWIKAYLASLHRLDQQEACEEADRALATCNQRWSQALLEPSWQFPHNFPLGASDPYEDPF